MKLNLTKPLIVFDLETTGLDLVNDRIIQISYIKVFPDGKEERENIFINPEKPIPAEVTMLTGISEADVADAPTFKQKAKELAERFSGCDFAGFNSNRFDVPMLAEEFLRAGEAHRADQDTEATWRVLQGELEMYALDKHDEDDRVLNNDMDELAEFSRMNDFVDFAGRMIWRDMTDKDGKQILTADGKPRRHEVFNFGKYKGWDVAEVLRKDPGYYSWILASDFTYNTKQVLTRIRLREFNNK